MGFREHRPGPPLGDYVDYLWSFEQNDAPDHPRERVLPTCTVELVVNACEAEGEARIYDSIAGERWLRGGAVAGCYTRAFEFDTRARIRTVGAHFKPGGAARLLGAPAGALANSHVELTDLWGPSATELHERLCAATTFHQQMHLLEKALIARLPDRPHHRPAVAVALAQLDQPGMEVGRVATVLGLSRRRLIEIFSEDVGMTPKRYAMVRRFQRALDLATRSPTPAWSRIAAECGYYDQAHLCRDWVEISGLSPHEHVGRRDIPVNPNHVAVPEVGVKSVQYASRSRK
jgi:AraC-like DNA-binding protein